MPSQFSVKDLQKMYSAHKKKKKQAKLTDIDVPIRFDESDILGTDDQYISSLVELPNDELTVE